MAVMPTASLSRTLSPSLLHQFTASLYHAFNGCAREAAQMHTLGFQKKHLRGPHARRTGRHIPRPVCIWFGDVGCAILLGAVHGCGRRGPSASLARPQLVPVRDAAPSLFLSSFLPSFLPRLGEPPAWPRLTRTAFGLSSSRSDAVIVSACRGKLADGYPKDAIGPLSNVFVPQKWFAHFYAIGCVSNALMIALSAWEGVDRATIMLLGAFQVHVVRRLMETVWMMRYPEGATMHVMAYVFGMSYYVVVPVTYVVACARGHGDEVGEDDEDGDSTRWWAILGVAIFAMGSLIQWHAHYLLAHLSGAGAASAPSRGGPKASRAKTSYVIPRGGLFELVSCPHYFGEAVIYLGLGVACVGYGNKTSTVAWYPFVWVVANLALAARLTHRWYLAHFKTYSRLGRKAFIPFLY